MGFYFLKPVCDLEMNIFFAMIAVILMLIGLDFFGKSPKVPLTPKGGTMVGMYGDYSSPFGG